MLRASFFGLWILIFAPSFVPRAYGEENPPPRDVSDKTAATVEPMSPMFSWGHVGTGLKYTAVAAVMEACILFNSAIAAATPDGYAGLSLVLAPLVGMGDASTAERAVFYSGVGGLALYNAALKEHDVTWDQVFETNVIAWHVLLGADLLRRKLSGSNEDATRVSPERPTGPPGPPDRFVFHGGVVGSRASGPVPLDTGYGGKIGVGVRSGPWEGRLTFLESAHDVRDDRQVTLGDSATAFTDWNIRSVGVDARRFARSGRRIQPFASGGVAYGMVTHGSDDFLHGWQLGLGAGFEVSVAPFVSVELEARAGRYFLDKGKVQGTSFELPEYQDETVVATSFGLVFYKDSGRRPPP